MKVTEAQFWEILTKNYGLYARTARAIEKEFNCTISRQALEDRAKKQPERLREIEEMGYDAMEGGIMELMQDEDKKVKIDAIKTFAKYKGRKRGWVEKKETEISGNLNTNTIDLSKLSTEELETYRKLQEKME